MFNNIPISLTEQLQFENIIIKDFKVYIPHSRTLVYIVFLILTDVHLSMSIRSNDIDYKKN